MNVETLRKLYATEVVCLGFLFGTTGFLIYLLVPETVYCAFNNCVSDKESFVSLRCRAKFTATELRTKQALTLGECEALAGCF